MAHAATEEMASPLLEAPTVLRDWINTHFIQAYITNTQSVIAATPFWKFPVHGSAGLARALKIQSEFLNTFSNEALRTMRAPKTKMIHFLKRALNTEVGRDLHSAKTYYLAAVTALESNSSALPETVRITAALTAALSRPAVSLEEALTAAGLL